MDNCSIMPLFANFRMFATSFADGRNYMVFIGKKTVICIVAATLVFALTAVGVFTVAKTVANSYVPLGAVVVIDAGHGGKESDLNLKIAMCLGDILTAKGVYVVYTRENENSLSDSKREDMKMRAEIIKESRPDCVVSIHLNSYSDAARRGVQVFYDDTGRGESFASLMQERINATINYRYSKRSDLAPQSGDFYITKCAAVPSIIIECGFISNAEDESLLKTESFRRELCREIADGIILAVA